MEIRSPAQRGRRRGGGERSKRCAGRQTKGWLYGSSPALCPRNTVCCWARSSCASPPSSPLSVTSVYHPPVCFHPPVGNYTEEREIDRCQPLIMPRVVEFKARLSSIVYIFFATSNFYPLVLKREKLVRNLTNRTRMDYLETKLGFGIELNKI